MLAGVRESDNIAPGGDCSISYNLFCCWRKQRTKWIKVKYSVTYFMLKVCHIKWIWYKLPPKLYINRKVYLQYSKRYFYFCFSVIIYYTADLRYGVLIVKFSALHLRDRMFSSYPKWAKDHLNLKGNITN